MSLKSLKTVRNASHYWKKPPFLFKCFKKSIGSFEKAHITLKKASMSLKIFLKSLAIFEKHSH
jgi:hypothetical protein